MGVALQPGQHGVINAKQQANKSWTAYTYYCSLTSGVVTQRQANAPTKAAALLLVVARLKDEVSKAKTAGHLDFGPACTITELVDSWLEDVAKDKTLATTSMTAYETVARLHLIPVLGSFKVKALTLARIKSWVRELHSVSPANAKRARSVLRGALDLAVDHELIMKNPLDGARVKLPRKKKKSAVTIAASNVEVMFAAADRHPYNNGRLGQYVRVQLGSGTRIGEVLALRRKDYTPRTPTRAPRIFIDGTLIQPARGSLFRQEDTKTPAGRRRIPITTFAAEAIEQRLAILNGLGRTDLDELIFQSDGHGTPVSPANLRRTWRKVRGSLPELEKLKFHALRATMATELYYKFGPEVASQMAGHSGTSALFNHYIDRREEVEVDLDVMESYSAPKSQLAIES